jgi:hypothetical protein
MKRALVSALCVVGIVVASMAVASCARSDSEKPGNVTELADPTDVIDEQLMLALAQAKNFHHKAKVYMSDGKLDDAIASVRQILSLRFPPGAPEGEDVRHDARALLAKLLVGKAQLDEAMTVVEQGLAQATRESFFVSNLHTVKGEIHRARAATYPDQKDPEAVQEKRKAIDEFDKSIKINERLLDEVDRR